MVPLLGGGLEPPRLSAYAPQTYVSAISPPERFRGTQLVSRTMLLASDSFSVWRSAFGVRRSLGAGMRLRPNRGFPRRTRLRHHQLDESLESATICAALA
jgi:hypothetical protein